MALCHWEKGEELTFWMLKSPEIWCSHLDKGPLKLGDLYLSGQEQVSTGKAKRMGKVPDENGENRENLCKVIPSVRSRSVKFAHSENSVPWYVVHHFALSMQQKPSSSTTCHKTDNTMWIQLLHCHILVSTKLSMLDSGNQGKALESRGAGRRVVE